MAVELSVGTVERLEQLFFGSDRAAVVELLVNECGDNLPFFERGTPESLERIRFGVLKLSGGDVERLLDAVRLAQIDWRDLLMASGFGEDVHAHERWWPR